MVDKRQIAAPLLAQDYRLDCELAVDRGVGREDDRRTVRER